MKLGISIGESLSLNQQIDMANYCEDHGFDSIWVGEGRLAWDAIVPLTLIANATSRVRLATGIIPNKSRIAPLIAVTFRTLDKVAPGRVMLGLGAWWEPLATNAGTPVRKPIRVMREYITVIRELFEGKTVTFQGEFVNVNNIRFDPIYEDVRPLNIPIYVGAVGFQMCRLVGQIADGALLDFLVPVEYNHKAVAAIRRGAEEAGRSLEQIDRPQLTVVCVNNEDPQEAVNHCRYMLTQYIGQQPHITKFSGVPDDVIAAVKSELGWPATNETVRKAMRHVSDEMVKSVAACGTVSDALEKMEEYVAAGATVPVLTALGDVRRTIEEIATANARR